MKYTSRALSIIIRSLVFHRPLMAFGLFGLFLSGICISAKIVSGHISEINVDVSLSSGLIILGAVSFMLGLLANVIFKRQMFYEKEMRHYIHNLDD